MERRTIIQNTTGNPKSVVIQTQDRKEIRRNTGMIHKTETSSPENPEVVKVAEDDRSSQEFQNEPIEHFPENNKDET